MQALVSIGDKKCAVREIPIPTPEAGEILVKVHYIAQNPTDWKGAVALKAGHIIGCDFAGTVEDPNSSHWRKGDRVAGFVQGGTENPTRGAFAEYAVIEASLVFKIPASTTFQEAAVIPLAFGTAVQALFQRLQLPEPSEPAQSALPVLIYGGASSVGLYAIQLSKQAGLFVVATGSERNHELLKRLGADVVVDYNEDDWVDQVRSATHDDLQHALDCIGDVNSTAAMAKALSTSNGGHLVSIGFRKQSDIDPALAKVKVESTIVYSVFNRPLEAKYQIFDNTGPAPQDKAFWEKYLGLLPDLLEQSKIKPNPLREFGGIQDILKGFQEHKQGKVSAEKLVYKIV